MGLSMEQFEKESREIICRRENGDEEEYLLTHVCGLDEPCASKLHICKHEEDVCKNICSRSSHICRVGLDDVCISGDNFDNLERFENIGSCGFAKLCRKLFKWFAILTYLSFQLPFPITALYFQLNFLFLS